MSDTTENHALGDRPHLDERPTYEPRARQEWFIVTRLAQAIPEAIRAHTPSHDQQQSHERERVILESQSHEQLQSHERKRVVLDVGCGRQPFRPLLQSLGYSYVGLDTQQNIDNTVAHVCPIDQGLPAALLADGPFDFILCTEVMEHVADWQAAFANFRHLLAPGGRLLITCPHLYPLHEEPYDFWRPTPHALRFYAAAFGLKVLAQQQIGDGLDVLGTTLASTKFRVPKGSWNPLAHLAVLKMQLWKAFGVWVCKRRFARSLFRAETKLYLSNLIVSELREAVDHFLRDG